MWVRAKEKQARLEKGFPVGCGNIRQLAGDF